MIETLKSIIMGSGSVMGIISFLYLLFRIIMKRMIKTNIEICDFIAKRKEKKDSLYTIKICNKTRYALIGIKAELLLMKKAVDSDDYIKNIPLLYSTISDIPGYNHPELGHFQKFQIENINIKDLLQDNHCYLVFKLACIHSKSKREEVFTRKFTRESIKEGNFVATSCEILSQEKLPQK